MREIPHHRIFVRSDGYAVSFQDEDSAPGHEDDVLAIVARCLQTEEPGLPTPARAFIAWSKAPKTPRAHLVIVPRGARTKGFDAYLESFRERFDGILDLVEVGGAAN